MRKESEAFFAARDRAKANPECDNAKFAAEVAFRRFQEACDRQQGEDDFRAFQNDGQ